MYQSTGTSRFSGLSSMRGELNVDEYVPVHYKEAYRLAIYALVSGGRQAYQDFLRAEGISDFLSEEELIYITENMTWPRTDDDPGEYGGVDGVPSTYCPLESDVEVPDLDLGWPEVTLVNAETNITLLFHPPRQNSPTIKEVIRKQIQDAKLVIAIAMDVFTDVDIFKDLVDVTSRGVVVYMLLDDFQFKSFLAMVEKTKTQIQNLRNMRVRTVKGQEYRCRSGVKFYGAMEQRFMLVDSCTVLYGSYSFMWSYEKINLSMVLSITGQLVASYDEEFRRLFARSTLPTMFPQESTLQRDHYNAKSHVPVYSPHSSQIFERRHSIDALYLKARSRGQLGLVTPAQKLNEEPHINGSLIRHGISVQDRLHRHHIPDSRMLVRGHSYAGELQKRLNASNRFRNGVGVFSPPGSQDPLLSDRMNKPYHGGADQLPLNSSFLSSSELSLHNWRIDAYLNNTSAPTVDSRDQLDLIGMQSDSKPFPFQSDHRRSLLIVKPQPPEQLASVSQRGNSTADLTRDDLPPNQNSLKRSDDYTKRIASPGPTRRSLKSVYATLHRATETLPVKDKECDKMDSQWNTEHSVGEEPSSHNRVTLGSGHDEENALPENLGDKKYTPTSLAGGHRSTSHTDIKGITGRTNPKSYNWQEPPSRTVSVTQLGIKSTEFSLKSSNLRRLCPFEDSNKTMISLVNIPEEREGLAPRESSDELPNSCLDNNKESGTDTTMPGTTDSGTSEGVSKTHFEVKAQISESGRGIENTTENLATLSEDTEKVLPASPIRLSTVINTGIKEERKTHSQIHYDSMSSIVTLESLGSRSSGIQYIGSAEARRKKVYSRFESFISIEKKPSDKLETSEGNVYALDKHRSFNMGNPRSTSSGTSSHSSGYSRFQTQTQNENKFGRFMQRVGNLIHKNK